MMRRPSRSWSRERYRPSRSRSRPRQDAAEGRRGRRDRGNDSAPEQGRGDRGRGGDRGDRHRGMPDAGAAAAAMWGQYAGYGAPGQMPGQMPGMGGAAGYGAPFWDPSTFGAAGMGEQKKKKKKKKKRANSGSSSSSSSSSVSDWRQKVWKQGFQGGMWPGMPGMQGQMPGQMPGMWPPGYPQPGGHDGAMQGGAPPMPPPPGSRTGQSAPAGWNVAEREAPPVDMPIFLEPSVEETVLVPKALIGKIIGKQACTLIQIREKSGVFKMDARDQTTDPCQVKVAGTADAVKRAKELIMELLESTRVKHASSEYVEIPRAKIGMVIGLKGAQVDEIQVQTGTKIDVDFESDPCRCYIKGEPDNTKRAKQVLLTIAMQIEDDGSEYLDLPKTASGALIGAQGSRVREFQEQSGARIDVDKTGSRCRVRLSGTAHQVANAKALILYEVENAPVANSTSMTHVPAPPPQPMQIPSHQPTSFPATLAESIARAKAAAQAVKTGFVSAPPSGAEPFSLGAPQAPAGGLSW